MASHLTELLSNLAFFSFALLSAFFAVAFVYVAGSIISLIIFYIKESIQSTDRPPIAGTIFHQLVYFDTIFDFQTNIARKHRTFRLIKQGHSEIYTSDPANVEHMLKTNFYNYSKGDYNYSVMSDLFGDGIFAVDGEKWRHQRKLASYEFSTKVLRDYSSKVFCTNAAKLAKKISDAASFAASINMQDLLMKSTLDSIFKVGFGVELETLSGSDDLGAQFSKAFDDSNQIVFHRYVDMFWKVKRFFNIGLEAELKRNIKIIDDFVFQMIRHKREQMSNGPDVNSKEDILSRFIIASEKDPENITDRYLRDISLNFLLAGKDTSANTLTWFFYILCKHPVVQEKIAIEIKESTGYIGGGGDAEEFSARLTEVLDNMHYLHAAITETLRLYPVVPVDGKCSDEDDILPDGFKVKKGDGMNYLTYAMGRMKYIWGDDAEDFLPERWLENGSFRPESPFKFASFNAGPRLCLGKEFAYRQMKILAAVLLHFFRFKLVDETKSDKYRTMFTLHIDKGLDLFAFHRTG